MADDSALLTAARAGDQQAFATLYRDHHRRALHEARKVVPNRSDAEDCVAAAFASTFMAIRNGGGPTDAFRPYLLTSVRNAGLQLVRLRRYSAEQATDEIEPPAHVDLYQIGADPIVRNAFQGLPARWREVLWKTEIEGRPPRELAEELAMSANSVAALAKRARDGFRKAYLTEAVGPDPHPWAVERLDLYRAGALDPRTSDLVELHVENCARCQDALAPVPISAASIGVILLAAGAATPAIGIAAGAGGATLIGRVRHLRPSHISAKAATAVAATVAVIGTLLVVVVSARSDDHRPQSSSTTVVPVSATGAGGGRGVAATVTLTEATGNVTETSSAATSAPAGTATAQPAVVETAEPSTEVSTATTRRATPTTRRTTPTTRRPVAPTTQPAPATDVAPTDAPTVPATEAPTTAIPIPPATEPATIAPTTVAPTTEAPTTTAAPTTSMAPQYGGVLSIQGRRPSLVAVVSATAPDGLPADTSITVTFTGPPGWSVAITSTANCDGMPASLGDGRSSATCTTPALARGATASVAFSLEAECIDVVVRAQRPGGDPATARNPAPDC